MTGKVALVTGGSRGIGLATARGLASRGAAVAITGTTDDTLSAACRELERDAAGRVLALRADVRSASDMTAACASVASRFGGLDALVNNAGVGLFRAVSEIAHATQHLLDELVSSAPPKNREVEAAKARERSANRFATVAP